MRWVLVMTLLMAACAPNEADHSLDPVYVAAAQDLCPMLWTWQTDVGSVMNDMSSASRAEDDAAARQRLYLQALDQVRRLNAQLDTGLSSLGRETPLDLIATEVHSGIQASNQILGEAEATIQTRYAESEEPLYGQVVSAMFIHIEKAIDVVKPEMASYGNDDLISAFRSVPQCQHGVKDANDGAPRNVP